MSLFKNVSISIYKALYLIHLHTEEENRKWKHFQIKFVPLFCAFIFHFKSQWTNNPPDDRFPISYATSSVFIQHQFSLARFFQIYLLSLPHLTKLSTPCKCQSNNLYVLIQFGCQVYHSCFNKLSVSLVKTRNPIPPPKKKTYYAYSFPEGARTRD